MSTGGEDYDGDTFTINGFNGFAEYNSAGYGDVTLYLATTSGKYYSSTETMNYSTIKMTLNPLSITLAQVNVRIELPNKNISTVFSGSDAITSKYSYIEY